MPAQTSHLDALYEKLCARRGERPWIRISGAVSQITPAAVRVEGISPFVALGHFVGIETDEGCVPGCVIRIEEAHCLIEVMRDMRAIALGQRCFLFGRHAISPHMSWRGRILNAFGEAIDGAGLLERGEDLRFIESQAPVALARNRVNRPLRTGVRVVDLFAPLCFGQRVGIFAGSGVGKSTLLAMLANAEGMDVVVIGLVGERGREVREFIEDVMGAARHKCVFVVATGDECAGLRRLAPLTAMTIAEFFRAQGCEVLLMLDSVTRYAHALRETALAAGELPVARGYTAGVFRDVPALLERAGPGLAGEGNITAIFSVLVDGDDHNDPIADMIRGTLDGHFVLDRTIAAQGRYPAMNISLSLSRLAQLCHTPDQTALITRLRAAVSKFEETRDVRMIGGFQGGQDPELDWAVALIPKLYQALTQNQTAPPSRDAFGDMAQLLAAHASAKG